MIFREGTNDATSVVADVSEYKNLDIRDGDVVLDIGGHIGLFALYAYERGAKHVVSVEPDKDNFNTHVSNLFGHPGHLVLRSAVVGSHRLHSVDLYTNPGRNKARHTIEATEGYDKVTVPATCFTCLVHMYEPDILKVDCESAEYGFDWTDIPSRVKSLAIEFHQLPERQCEFDRIHEVLLASGFTQSYITPDDRSFMLHIYHRGDRK